MVGWWFLGQLTYYLQDRAIEGLKSVGGGGGGDGLVWVEILEVQVDCKTSRRKLKLPEFSDTIVTGEKQKNALLADMLGWYCDDQTNNRERITTRGN